MSVKNKSEIEHRKVALYCRVARKDDTAMENQVPSEQVKEGFDKLLKVVQETAGKRALLSLGKIVEVLVEDQNQHNPALMSGRMSNNMMVHFPGTNEIIGQIVPVTLDECKGFYYLGTPANKL